MAIFDDFLEKYQAHVKEALEKEITPQMDSSIDGTLEVLELAINCHTGISDQFKYQHIKWEKETRRLCELRSSLLRVKKAHIPSTKETA